MSLRLFKHREIYWITWLYNFFVVNFHKKIGRKMLNCEWFLLPYSFVRRSYDYRPIYCVLMKILMVNTHIPFSDQSDLLKYLATTLGDNGLDSESSDNWSLRMDSISYSNRWCFMSWGRQRGIWIKREIVGCLPIEWNHFSRHSGNGTDFHNNFLESSQNWCFFAMQ